MFMYEHTYTSCSNYRTFILIFCIDGTAKSEIHIGKLWQTKTWDLQALIRRSKSFPLRISSVNVTKSGVSCGFFFLFFVVLRIIFKVL